MTPEERRAHIRSLVAEGVITHGGEPKGQAVAPERPPIDYDELRAARDAILDSPNPTDNERAIALLATRVLNGDIPE